MDLPKNREPALETYIQAVEKDRQSIDARTAVFNLLPKIHKQGNPGQPIVSLCGAPTEKISQFVDHHLHPHVGTRKKRESYWIHHLKSLAPCRRSQTGSLASCSYRTSKHTHLCTPESMVTDLYIAVLTYDVRRLTTHYCLHNVLTVSTLLFL